MYRQRRFNNARFTVSSPLGCVGRVLQTRFRVPPCVYKPARAGNGLQTCMLSKCKEERGHKVGLFGISRPTLCTWAGPCIKTARRYERRCVCFGLPLSRQSDDGVFDDSGAVHTYLRGPSCGLDLSLDKFAYFPLIPIYFTFEIYCVSCIPAISVREPRHIRHTVYTVASKTWPWF